MHVLPFLQLAFCATQDLVSESKLLELNENARISDIKYLFDILPKSVIDLYEYALNDDYPVYSYISEQFNNINEEIYEDTKDIINQKRLYL